MYTGHCDCTHRRRIDHRLLVGNTMIAVETDQDNINFTIKKMKLTDMMIYI